MNKIIFFVLFLSLVVCNCENDQDEQELDLIGVVINETSCGGGPEPVFIIRLGVNDSIMTATLPKEFQVTDLKIQFKTKESSSDLFCTTDKIYPENFDVFDVILFLD